MLVVPLGQLEHPFVRIGARAQVDGSDSCPGLDCERFFSREVCWRFRDKSCESCICGVDKSCSPVLQNVSRGQLVKVRRGNSFKI
jgi:hypothetical protein